MISEAWRPRNDVVGETVRHVLKPPFRARVRTWRLHGVTGGGEGSFCMVLDTAPALATASRRALSPSLSLPPPTRWRRPYSSAHSPTRRTTARKCYTPYFYKWTEASPCHQHHLPLMVFSGPLTRAWRKHRTMRPAAAREFVQLQLERGCAATI